MLEQNFEIYTLFAWDNICLDTHEIIVLNLSTQE